MLIDIERKVIGGVMLLDGAPMEPAVSALAPEYFSCQQHSQIWAAVDELRSAGDPVDEITVTEKLQSWDVEKAAEMIIKLAWDMPTAVNLDHWARMVLDAGRKRELSRRLYDATANSEVQSFDEAAVIVQDAIRGLEDAIDTGGMVHIKEPLAEVMRQLEAERENPDAGVICKTGLLNLDKDLKMRATHLTVIAGRPGMGKSSLAGNIAQHVARKDSGATVGLFALEMDAASLVRRMLTAECSGGDILIAIKDGRGIVAANKIFGLNLYIDDRPSLSIESMRQSIRRLGNVQLVLVDYLQLAKLDRKLERQDLRVGAITKGLKAMAKEFDCHVIALSQLSRATERNEKHKPKLSDLRDSGNIEEDADSVLLLYRPAYYGIENEDDQIIIAKQRHGPTGVVTVKWNPKKQKFSDLSKRQEYA